MEAVEIIIRDSKIPTTARRIQPKKKFTRRNINLEIIPSTISQYSPNTEKKKMTTSIRKGRKTRNSDGFHKQNNGGASLFFFYFLLFSLHFGCFLIQILFFFQMSE